MESNVVRWTLKKMIEAKSNEHANARKEVRRLRKKFCVAAGTLQDLLAEGMK